MCRCHDDHCSLRGICLRYYMNVAPVDTPTPHSQTLKDDPDPDAECEYFIDLSNSEKMNVNFGVRKKK